jgi:hypothetical protein
MDNDQEGLSTAEAPARNVDGVRAIAKKCQHLVEQTAVGFLSRTQFLERLKELGASVDEANDYVEQLTHRLRGQQQSRNHGDQASRNQDHDALRASLEREHTPEGLEGQDLVDFWTRQDVILSESADKAKELEETERRKRATKTVAWAVLQAKLGQLDCTTLLGNDHPSSSFSEDLVNLLGLSHSSFGSIPSSVLMIAPHIGKLSSQIKTDPHLDQTRKYRVVFNKSDQVWDALINDLQLVSLAEPIPQSIWKKIVQDDYVEFEKLYASMDQRYDHKDEPKSLCKDFAIVKKDQASAKQPLLTEAKWIQVFSAWSLFSLIIFPSFRHTIRSLWNSFGQPQSVLSLRFSSTSKFVTAMPRNHSTWTTGASTTSLFLHKCFALLHLLLQRAINTFHQLHQLSHRNEQILHVITGVWESVVIHAQIVRSMGSAAFVVRNIEPKRMRSASLASRLEPEGDPHQKLLDVVKAPMSIGSLGKRKSDLDLEIPRFR